MKTKMYLHGDKGSNWETGEDLGLTDKALENFGYALYEVCFDVDIDEQTGFVTILKVDGKELVQ